MRWWLLKECNYRHINIETWYKLKPHLQDYAGKSDNGYVWYSDMKTNPSIKLNPRKFELAKQHLME